jgi:hypothetical protein
LNLFELFPSPSRLENGLGVLVKQDRRTSASVKWMTILSLPGKIFVLCVRPGSYSAQAFAPPAKPCDSGWSFFGAELLLDPTTYSFRTVACPAARNFPYDMVAETTIAALRAQAPAKRSATLLLTLIGVLIACSKLAESK